MRGMSSSSSSTTSCYYNNHHGSTTDHGDVRNNNKLVLKLDYEKIMKSWVNKGPLYICGNSGLDAPQPQTVPDIRDDDFFFPTSINVSYSLPFWYCPEKIRLWTDILFKNPSSPNIIKFHHHQEQKHEPSFLDEFDTNYTL
ncbi:hypothetical protein Tco_0971911 [Tanacetum coccineum]